MRSKITFGRICIFEKRWTIWHQNLSMWYLVSVGCWLVFDNLLCDTIPPQSEDPAVRWQLNLYKDIVMRIESPPDPDRVVDRIQRISAAVFNLEQVRPRHSCTPEHIMSCKWNSGFYFNQTFIHRAQWKTHGECEGTLSPDVECRHSQVQDESPKYKTGIMKILVFSPQQWFFFISCFVW